MVEMIDIESHTHTLIARRWSVTIDLIIAAAERMPIIFGERRRYWRITETWMPANVGRGSIGNIATRGLDTIVMTLLSSLRVCRRWRSRRVIGGWLRM
jgi:hypothetical protein